MCVRVHLCPANDDGVAVPTLLALLRDVPGFALTTCPSGCVPPAEPPHVLLVTPRGPIARQVQAVRHAVSVCRGVPTVALGYSQRLADRLLEAGADRVVMVEDAAEQLPVVIRELAASSPAALCAQDSAPASGTG